MKGISRIEHEGKKMYGWLVRAYGGGRTFSKYFSDKRFGSKEISLEKAVEYRERLTREVKTRYAGYVTRQNQPPFRRKPSRANKSGLVGIHRCETVNHGKPVKYWAATWNENGKPRDKKFYFNNKIRSEEDAKKLAIEWRAKKLQELSASGKNGQVHSRLAKGRSGRALTRWVPGLQIEQWSPASGVVSKTEARTIKKREPLVEKRIRELQQFLGVAATLFDWSNIDFEFGRGVFEGDVRSRCFWNTSGIRTDVLVDVENRIVVKQGMQADPYYLHTVQRS